MISAQSRGLLQAKLLHILLDEFLFLSFTYFKKVNKPIVDLSSLDGLDGGLKETR